MLLAIMVLMMIAGVGLAIELETVNQRLRGAQERHAKDVDYLTGCCNKAEDTCDELRGLLENSVRREAELHRMVAAREKEIREWRGANLTEAHTHALAQIEMLKAEIDELKETQS